jgi:hypothetical protein
MDNYGGKNPRKIPKKIKFMDNYSRKNTCEGAKSCLLALVSFSFYF